MTETQDLKEQFDTVARDDVRLHMPKWIGWEPFHTQVDHLAERGGQASADLAQGLGLLQLAENHGNELIPATKAFNSLVGSCFFDKRFELNSWKKG